MHFRNTCHCYCHVKHVSCTWISRILIKSRNSSGENALRRRWFGNHFRRESFKQLPETYNPQDVEHGVQEFWLNAPPTVVTQSKTTEYFSMILPPPNVTGNLHLGHALTVTIQDILTRWQSMKGKRVIWIPGFDHAGIATQTTFEKKLWKEKKITRYDLGREEVEKELQAWRKEKCTVISNQLRRMGASLDWAHEYFTLDSHHSEAVKNAFIQLHSDGLIYRAESIVNWCCVLQSALSDIEVDNMDISGPTLVDLPNYEGPIEFGLLTNFAYKTPNGADELVVSTTRLETMLGDTAVAVHPSDTRYIHWHGAHLWHPFLNKIIPVVCDESVDPKFGTGVVKITPAHSQMDFEIGKKNSLECLTVIDEKGIMNERCNKFKGLKRFEAREKIKNELAKLGLLRGQKNHAMSIPICSRTGDVIEFILKPQWFLSCQEMAKAAVEVVENGQLQIIPSSYNNVWFTWLNNIRDWCISRQLWWGHRIPAYECYSVDSPVRLWVAADNTEEARKIAVQKLNLSHEEGQKIIIAQDIDVLDTWFSSALLPFSALGWPRQSDNLKQFYPLSVMETGHDILFFWVARMVMLGTYFTGKLPFEKVILHGILCDSFGRKMSKSLGNVIDPQDVINGSSAENLLQNAHANYGFGLISAVELNRTLKSNKIMFPKGIPDCGSDALRFSLSSYNISNASINFDVVLCHKNRQFCTKMWQACRYIQKSYDVVFSETNVIESAPPSKFDKWIVSRLAYLVHHVDESLNSQAFHFAANALKNFVVNELCTTYLEGTKSIVRDCNASSARVVETLVLCMDVALRALNPFMPFITEYLNHHLPLKKTDAFTSYPSPQEWISSRDEVIEEEIKSVLTVVTALLHLQSTYRISKKDDCHGYIECTSDDDISRFQEHIALICALSHVPNVEISPCIDENLKIDAVHMMLNRNSTVYLKASKRKDELTERLEKIRRYLLVHKDLEKLYKITSHPRYRVSAPERVQLKHKERIAVLEAEVNQLKKYQEIATGNSS